MQTHYLRYAIVLGLVSAIGPFAIDMYLPALPTIAADLGASASVVQLSLVVFFISTGVGPLVAGPMADIYGRKPVLYGGLAFFALASIGAALAPTVEWLIAFRFLQGLAASTGMVVPRAVVRDLHTGPEATRLMALLMLVFSISPILAPLTGSAIIAQFGWRAVFWAVTVAAGLAALLMMFALEETRPKESRRDSSFAAAFSGYGALLRDRSFLALCLIAGFAISSFFVYLANSSFVLIEHYGVTPTVYSIYFSINAVSFFAMSQLAGPLSERYGLKRVVRIAISCNAAVMMALLAVKLAGVDSLTVMAAMLFVGYGFLGLVIPTTSVLAMEQQGARAGTASALMGTIHLATGALAMALSGMMADGSALPMVAGIAICSGLAFTLAHVTLRTRATDAVEVAAE